MPFWCPICLISKNDASTERPKSDILESTKEPLHGLTTKVPRP